MRDEHSIARRKRKQYVMRSKKRHGKCDEIGQFNMLHRRSETIYNSSEGGVRREREGGEREGGRERGGRERGGREREGAEREGGEGEERGG